MKFKYDLAECDVRRSERARLKKFRERLVAWGHWLSEDEHSIWQQINRMLWNDTVFRTINESRGLATKHPSPSVGFNGPVAAFIDQSYVASQLLAIRRLTEKNERGDAITLQRVIDDMKRNADLFTRELYVCHDGLPFDTAPVRARAMRRLMKEARKGVVFTGMPTSGPEAHDTADRVHENFDARMARKPGDPRGRDDRLDPAIFDLLKSKLGACAKISDIASKFIAHAADAGSRGLLRPKERGITLEKIQKCQVAICRVAAYINGPLLYIGSHGLIATPQFDQLEYFDKAWADAKNMDALYRYWEKRVEKVEDWIGGNWIKQLGMPG